MSAGVLCVPHMAAPYREMALDCGHWLVCTRRYAATAAEHTSVLFRAQHVSLWSALSGIGCSAGVNAVGCRNWIHFTVPALRMVAYSAGAILCSRLQHTGSL